MTRSGWPSESAQCTGKPSAQCRGKPRVIYLGFVETFLKWCKGIKKSKGISSMKLNLPLRAGLSITNLFDWRATMTVKICWATIEREGAPGELRLWRPISLSRLCQLWKTELRGWKHWTKHLLGSWDGERKKGKNKSLGVEFGAPKGTISGKYPKFSLGLSM